MYIYFKSRYKLSRKLGLPSIEDRGQIGRVTILDNPNLNPTLTLDPDLDLWPWFLTGLWTMHMQTNNDTVNDTVLGILFTWIV